MQPVIDDYNQVYNHTPSCFHNRQNRNFASLKNIYMAYTLSNQRSLIGGATRVHKLEQENFLTRFLNWCNTQESNRFLWLGVTFFAQIGLMLPLAAFSILFLGGNNFLLWIIICAVNLPTLVLNLAALPTKVTLPFLFIAWLTELSVVLYCVFFALLH